MSVFIRKRILRVYTAVFAGMYSLCGCADKGIAEAENAEISSVYEQEETDTMTVSLSVQTEQCSPSETTSSMTQRHHALTTEKTTSAETTEKTEISTTSYTNENDSREEVITERTEEWHENSNTDAPTVRKNEITTVTADLVIITTEISRTTAAAEENDISEDIADGQLVRILDHIPDAVIDLKYATHDNFTGEVIYDDPEAYLCYGTVKKLINVQEQLKEMGYSILIWDAYRSPESQWKLWNVYPDPNFVADPRNGITSHSRGNTIDITIADKEGNPIVMPSAFDEFTAIADRDYSDADPEAASNAQLLERIMFSCGFTGYRGEWWDYSDTQRYELISIKKK